MPLRLDIRTVRTLDDSIDVMREAVGLGLKDPKTRELALCLTREIEPRDDMGEIGAIFAFIQKNVRYVADPRFLDTFQTLERTLQFGAGDCDDSAVADSTLLESIGFKTSFRVIHSKGSASWNHVYLLVHLPKRRPTGILPLDHTLANPRVGQQPPPHTVVKFRDFVVLKG